MVDATAQQDAAPAGKGSRRLLLAGAGAALILGGAGFFATYAGYLNLPGSVEPQATETTGARPDIAFVPIEPLILSLGKSGNSQHLRFEAELEVESRFAADVRLLLPRILDVLNGYLRAVDVAELEDPSALIRLRAQMLRRIQIVTGEGRVRDLLITEFVLN